MSKNYLELVPQIPEGLVWKNDEKGIVTLEIKNTGLMNKIAQKLFKKPRVSFIHLDELGSFVWLQINGKRNITEISDIVHEHFGENAEPLYERISKYFQILESYKFINTKTEGISNER